MNSPKITQTYLLFFMSNPFATGYIEPSAPNKFLKFNPEGSYLFRILTPKDQVITYYKGFKENTEEKESKVWTAPDKGDGQLPEVPKNIKLKTWNATDNGFKLYWSVVVFNYDTNTVQIWDMYQKVFKDSLFAIASSRTKNDWTKFDIEIIKKGEKTESKYTLLTGENQELSDEIKKIITETPVNLKAMETGEDPFAISDLPEIDDKEVDELIEKMETKQHPDTYVATPF